MIIGGHSPPKIPTIVCQGGLNFPGRDAIRPRENIGYGNHLVAKGNVVKYLKGVSNVIFIRINGIGDPQGRGTRVNYRIVLGTANVKLSGSIIDRIDKEPAVCP